MIGFHLNRICFAKRLVQVVAVVVWFVSLGAGSAQELPSFEEAAAKIQSVTVTVRTPLLEDREQSSGDGGPSENVTVFSGCRIGKGLVLAPLLMNHERSRVRITLAGGLQKVGRGRLFDQVSGLTLLEVDDRSDVDLKIADEPPKVGSWVIGGSGWGAEKPVISFGMVSGVDRRLPGSKYPPLIQCNLTSTQTSSGSPILDRDGQLLGIVVGVDAGRDSRGWVYAVPTRHIHRLLRLYKENFSGANPDRKAMVIPWRRPIVGMQIDGGEQIVVSRVTKGGPAERAGIQKGDGIIAVDGVLIRSVYQAVSPTISKQPGDTVTFTIERDGEAKELEVVLGGTVAVKGDATGGERGLLQPKVEISRLDLSRNGIRELGTDGEDELIPPPVDKLQLLEKAIHRYHSVIERQQEVIRKLEGEVEELKKRLPRSSDE